MKVIFSQTLENTTYEDPEMPFSLHRKVFELEVHKKQDSHQIRRCKRVSTCLSSEVPERSDRVSQSID